jgi:hypothetical protein
LSNILEKHKNIFGDKLSNIIKITLVSALITTIIVYTIKCLIFYYYGLNILFIQEHPIISFFTAYGFNGLRIIVRYLVEEKYQTMSMASNGNNTTGNTNPGYSYPGNNTTGNTNPGYTYPGNMNPGNNNPGSMDPGNPKNVGGSFY